MKNTDNIKDFIEQNKNLENDKGAVRSVSNDQSDLKNKFIQIFKKFCSEQENSDVISLMK